jgi:hypothetical protein
MDRQRMEYCLAQVAAYRASGQKAQAWSLANGIKLRELASWCAHAKRWRAVVDGVTVESAVRKPGAGFVAARLPIEKRLIVGPFTDGAQCAKHHAGTIVPHHNPSCVMSMGKTSNLSLEQRPRCLSGVCEVLQSPEQRSAVRIDDMSCRHAGFEIVVLLLQMRIAGLYVNDPQVPKKLDERKSPLRDGQPEQVTHSLVLKPVSQRMAIAAHGTKKRTANDTHPL